jgi:hypothetical protein
MRKKDTDVEKQGFRDLGWRAATYPNRKALAANVCCNK